MTPGFQKLATPFLCLVLLGVLSGCAVVDVGMLILSLPIYTPPQQDYTPPQQAETPGYTLGPVSLDEFPTLLHNAIPSSEGEVHVFGPALWSGFQNGERYIEAVAAITDRDILLLMWHEPEHQYTIVTRLPFSEILSISAYPGGGTIHLYFDDEELSLGNQNYGIDGETTFRFFRPSHQEKNEVAFLLLQSKIKLHESYDPTLGQSFDDDY